VVKHFIEDLGQHEILGDLIGEKSLSNDYARTASNTAVCRPPDRIMVCGGPAMLSDTCAMLNLSDFSLSTCIGEPGDYVIERAFV
jgi:hypothetical protein